LKEKMGTHPGGVREGRSDRLLWIGAVLFLLLLIGLSLQTLSEARKEAGFAVLTKGYVFSQRERSEREKEVRSLEWDFIKVPGGTFEMGDIFGTGHFDEVPVHLVTLADFWIGKYEVTQAQWKAVMVYNPSNYPGDDRPVENVTPAEVDEFIRRLNFLTGEEYRLPTEAEWEYAARSGGKKEKFSGSDHADDVAWFFRNSGRPGTFPVGKKAPNGLGIHDMSGNVWEVCADWYDAAYYAVSPTVDPPGPATGVYRVVRGGRWGYDPASARTTNRFNDFGLILWGDSLGFRLAKSS